MTLHEMVLKMPFNDMTLDAITFNEMPLDKMTLDGVILFEMV